MDTKLFARIGAGAFVAIALTMTALELREEPVRQVPETETVKDTDSDPLPGILRSCAAMGESALNDPACRSAWAEKRRRFLGVDAPVPAASEPLALPVDSQPAEGQ